MHFEKLLIIYKTLKTGSVYLDENQFTLTFIKTCFEIVNKIYFYDAIMDMILCLVQFFLYAYLAAKLK